MSQSAEKGLLTDDEHKALDRGQWGFRAVLRAHEPLPGLPRFCACGHQATTPLNRETHIVEALIAAPSLRRILASRTKVIASDKGDQK